MQSLTIIILLTFVLRPHARKFAVSRNSDEEDFMDRMVDGIADKLFDNHQGIFANSLQSGFLSILYSLGSKPLQIWSTHVRNGHIKRLTDFEINSGAIEIIGDIAETYISCPCDPRETLGIKLPCLVMIIKNVNDLFSFEVEMLDHKDECRRFRASNFQRTARVKHCICTMPLSLDEGWNQIQINLADCLQRAYSTKYMETLRVHVHANCRIRRIYFSDRLCSADELPPQLKIFIPDISEVG